MSDKKDNTLAYVLLGVGVVVLGYAAYSMMQTPSTGNSNNTQIPPNATINTQWGQWQNTTGQPVWVTATGVVVTAAGTLLGPISQLVAALNNNSSSGSNTNFPAVDGKRKRIGLHLVGEYYNPLPGAFI